MAKQQVNQQVVEHKDDNRVMVANGEFKVGARSDALRIIMLDAAKAGNIQENDDSSISNRLLVIAKSYQDPKDVRELDGKRDDNASECFVSICKVEEDFIKSKEAGDNQREKLPRCWTQAKSNIKASIEYGIDLAQFNSESALRKEVIKARGMRPKDAVRAGINAIREKLVSGEIPQQVALDLIHQMEAAIEAALQELVPVQPVKQDKAA